MTNDGFLALIIILALSMIGLPVILTIIGLFIRKTKPNTAKTLFIIAVVYIIVGLGICGTLIS